VDRGASHHLGLIESRKRPSVTVFGNHFLSTHVDNDIGFPGGNERFAPTGQRSTRLREASHSEGIFVNAASRKLCENILTNGVLRRNLLRVLKTVPLALADRQEKARILSSDPPKLPTLWESIRD
jgi:hypothetical protein